MASIDEATVAGVNKFIEEQKQVPGTATLRLVQFDDVYEEVFDTLIAVAPELTLSKTPREGQKTYEPRGSTALLDAIGRTVTELGTVLAALPEEERPSKVIVVIMTDGLENASRVFSKDKVLAMITAHQRLHDLSAKNSGLAVMKTIYEACDARVLCRAHRNDVLQVRS
jgi:hypothetical protein